MPWELQTEIALRLALSFAAGAILGYERAHQHKPAGSRTHALVCLASALFMIISLYGFGGGPGITRDPARVAAQVVTGMGFIGAGVIWREGSWVRGITTASTLWVASALGLAIGTGLYLPAFITLGLAYLGLEFPSLRRLLTGSEERALEALDLGPLKNELERLFGRPVKLSGFNAGDPYMISFGFGQSPSDRFALTFSVKRHTVNLTLLFIPEPLRGRGYARRTVEALLGWAERQGFQQVVLTSTPELVPMWEKLGFSPLDPATLVYRLGK
ncbi:MAG: GNAT family N-acetyltransferase [Moorellales bacterium]